MTKKQKAELLISVPEIKNWVKGHLKCRVQSYGNWVPTDLWEFKPPNLDHIPNGKVIIDWLTNPNHLYNGDGCIALMNAFLDKI